MKKKNTQPSYFLRLELFIAKITDVELSQVRVAWFLMYCTLLMILFISNNYYSNDIARAINTLNKEIDELQSEYVSLTSEVMLKGRMSKVSEGLKDKGLKPSVTPPTKIVVYDQQ
jgi:cell division protein FtsL